METVSPFLRDAFIFILGVIGTIVVSILANLLTPDRETLINRYRNWRAKRSVDLARARVLELQKELDETSKMFNSQTEFALFLAKEIAQIIMFFIQGTLALAIAVLVQLPLIPLILDSGIILLPFIIWNYGRALFRIDEINSRIANLKDFNEYKHKTELKIEYFKEKSRIQASEVQSKV